MNTSVSAGAARALGFLAVSGRLFLLLAVEYALAQNAAWISALLGLVLALPVLWLMSALEKNHPDCATREIFHRGSRLALRGMCVVLLPFLVLNAASGARYVFMSANYAALTDIGEWTLLIPLFLVFLYALASGGRGIAGSAKLTLVTIPWLIAIVILAQLRYYKLSWLTPVLGGGVVSIISCSIRAAGAYLELFALWLICTPDGASGENGLRPLKIGILAGLFASTLLVLYAMMSPVSVSGSISPVARLNVVLYNGRAPLALHLPIMTVWMLCLLHQIAFSALVAVGILGILLPNIRRVYLNIAVILCSATAAMWGKDPTSAWISDILGLWYPVVGAGTAVLFALGISKEAKHA